MVLIVPDNVWQSVSFRKYKATYSIGSKTNVLKIQEKGGRQKQEKQGRKKQEKGAL